jgi:hypothetical protein
MEPPAAIPASKRFTAAGIKDFLSYLRSLLFTNNLIYLYTAVMGTLSLGGSLFESGGRWQHACARFWSRLILKTSGVKVRVEGLEHMHANAPAIFCVNHQSSMDIPVLLVSLAFQFRFMAKRSLFRYPFIGLPRRIFPGGESQPDGRDSAVQGGSLSSGGSRRRSRCSHYAEWDEGRVETGHRAYPSRTRRDDCAPIDPHRRFDERKCQGACGTRAEPGSLAV